MSFFRRIEDFKCEHCGAAIAGDGYTNHCSKCFWSKHVDIEPGDRAETCGGTMKPISAERKGDGWTLVHECMVCGHTKRNKMSASDNFDIVSAFDFPAI